MSYKGKNIIFWSSQMIKQTKFTFFPVEETFRKQKSMSKLYRVLESSKKP